MNKRVDLHRSGRNYLPLLLVLGLLFFAACASTHRERMLEEIADAPLAEMESEALEAQFKAERLSDDELKAFESRAIQKLEDFSDYVNLLADSTLDSVFRQQAVRQALLLFVNEETEIRMFTDKEKVGSFLQSFGKEQQTSEGYVIQGIQVQSPLQPAADRTYQGALSFHQQLAAHNEAAVSRQAHILLRKVRKSFGEREEWVWEVLIAGIE
ncbi:hypothetical protein [Catalinimonas niigatensis]|uniref:hypothetical protein n=1 Tax=Catalinimonas niigatensis TaxID=1397264 RepID=UPI002665360E|nr:hypothetical protein [Catalinimonas niigatensis]WPP53042.1 hypothetical protein PZB72_11710 [Catalinimonas niigatensis]